MFYYSLYPATAQLLSHYRYTTKDGLIADRITAIQQDEQGVMWFGSYFGLCSYDGISFKKIPLPFVQENKYVTSILPVGNKIFAGFLFGGGLAEYANGRVKSHSLLKLNPTTSNDVMAIGNFNDSSILVGNGSAEVYLFSNGMFKFLYSLHDELGGGAIHSLFKDSINNIWISSENGLFIIPSSGKKNMLWFFKGNDIVSFLPLHDKIWIATSQGANGSVFTCEGLNGKELRNLSQTLSLPGLSQPGLHGKPVEGFWALHRSKGLFKISSSGSVNHYASVLNMDADVKALFTDRENNLWIANDPGIVKISNFSSVSWLFNEAAATGGFILRESNGSTWVTNAKYLYRIKNDSMTKLEFREKEFGYIGKMLFDGSGSLWMTRWDEGIWKTTWKEDKLVQKKYFNSFGDKKIIGGMFQIDANGNIWIGGGNGIFRIKNDMVVEQYDPVTSSGHLFINVSEPDVQNKILWLGDNALGLVKVRYRIGENGKYHYTIEKIFGPNEGLKDPYVRSMTMDYRGDLWIGTRAGGIYKLSHGANRVESFGPPLGIECSRITAFAKEKKDAIWVATCDGIYRYEYKTNQWQHYNVSDGLLSAEVFHLAVDADRQQVWAQTELGITRIDLRSSKEASIPPLVHLTQVNVLGKPDTSALFKNELREYKFKENSIGFVFAGSSFLNEKKIMYKYMLTGYDKQWSEPVTTNTVNYASLAPGRYTFKVLAANARGIWSEEPATFNFQIILPFYRRPWFIFSSLAFIGLLVYLVHVYRLKQQFKVEKLRMRIARDLHDDIGSALGSINLMSETANRRLAKAPLNSEVAEVFQRIGYSAQSTLESMDDIIWSINPDKDKLGDLVVRMREFAIPLLEAKEIEFDFKVNAADYRKLTMDFRKNIFLIFKEAIFNTVKHAQCTSVSITTEIRNNIFCLQVEDNGIGFDPDKPTNRNGIKNMEKRSRMLGGILSIGKPPQGGTKMEFKCLIK